MKKKKNEKNRYRNVIVNFRMSPEERAELDKRVLFSGMSKQRYMIQSSLYQKIVVVGKDNIMDEVKKELYQIKEELQRISKVDEVDIEKLAPLRTIIEMVQGF